MKTPYFYIIKHKESGKRYAGSKWAKDADTDSFMTSLEKFGVEHYAKSDLAKENFKKVCLERYGVDNPSKKAEVCAKGWETRRKKKLEAEQLLKEKL